jgi:hypothetical protein
MAAATPGPVETVSVLCYVLNRRCVMADDKSKRGSRDRKLISLSEKYEVRYWSKKFGVTPDRLRQVVEKVGHSAKAVEEELKSAA